MEDREEQMRQVDKAISNATFKQHAGALHNVLAWCKSIRTNFEGKPSHTGEAISDSVLDLLEQGLNYKDD